MVLPDRCCIPGLNPCIDGGVHTIGYARVRTAPANAPWLGSRPRGRNGGRTFALSKAQVRLAQAAMAHRDTSVSELCRELGILRRWPMHRRVRVGEDLDLRRFIVRYVDDGTRGLQILRELDEAVVDQVGTASAPPRTAPSGTRTRCSISSSPSRRQSGYRSASASRRRSATPPSGPTSRSARGRGPCGQGCPTLRGPPPRSSVRPPPSQPHRRKR